MKKNLLFIFIFISVISFAQTTIPAGIVNGTWTFAGSPYNIQGNIQIVNGDSLIIQPGVTVSFQGTYTLLVLGKLKAIGTVIDTITFTAPNTTTGWRGIRFDNTPATNDSSKIKYCKLQYGIANGNSTYVNGGAFYFNGFSKALISNCRILNCAAGVLGGGIYCKSSSPNINNNTIINNTASRGAGIYCSSGSSPNISNNIINNNGGANAGGGIYCDSSSVIINNNSISNNTASSGSGIGYSGNGNTVIINTTITNNTGASGGGGIYMSGGNLTISSTTISYNTSTSTGGGIYLTGGSLIISNTTISNNTSANYGGGIYLSGGSVTISNTTITNNTTTNSGTSGGGIYCQSGGSPTITNTIISNNSSGNGGGLYCNTSSNPTLRNCILWGNTASTNGAQVFLSDQASCNTSFYYCDLQGGTVAFALNGNIYTGTYSNNINADPKFVSPSAGAGSSFNGVTANWSLQNTSPCIDTGDPNNTNGFYPATDKAGNPRVTVCRIDMGAYEYQNGVPFLLNVSKQNILCNGNKGTATATITGGSTPYTYSWSNGQTTSIATGLLAGNYTITVNEAGNCIRTGIVSITSPALLTTTFSSTNASSCGMKDGSAIANSSGGTSPYTYQWSTGQTTQTSTGMRDNIYSVLITDANGCTSYNIATVGTNPPSSIPICIVTVDSTSSKNVLVWDKPVNTAIDSFKIYREISSVFTPIASVTYSALSTFTDNTNGVNPNITSYRYEISVKDTCGNESAKSVLHRTMHLAVSPASPCGYNLFWNDYIGFPVMKYMILRNTTGNYNNWQTLDSVSLGINVWTDTTCSLPPITAYMVEVIAPAGGCTPTLIKNNPQPMATTIKGSKSNSYRIIGNSINEISLENLISISPNPNNGEFTVQSSKIKCQNLEVYNVYGEKVYSEIVNRNSDLVTLDLPNGIYFAHIQTEMGAIVKKVIVTH